MVFHYIIVHYIIEETHLAIMEQVSGSVLLDARRIMKVFPAFFEFAIQILSIRIDIQDVLGHRNASIIRRTTKSGAIKFKIAIVKIIIVKRHIVDACPLYDILILIEPKYVSY